MKLKSYGALQTEADAAMAAFDFEKVQRVMEFLNWGWCGSKMPPTIDELKSTAIDLLFRAIDEFVKRGQPAAGMVTATGGFEARVDTFESGESRVVLLFYVDRTQG